MEALALLVEALLATQETSDTLAFLRWLAAKLASESNVVSLGEGAGSAKARARAAAWLDGRLTVWLATYGEPVVMPPPRAPARRKRARAPRQG